MKIRKVEKTKVDYPKENEVSEKEIKRKIPKKFLVLGVIGGAGVIAAAVGLAAYVYSLSTVVAGMSPSVDFYYLQANRRLSIYSGDKKRGAEVKEVLNLVDTLNKRDELPIDVDIIYEERE